VSVCVRVRVCVCLCTYIYTHIILTHEGGLRRGRAGGGRESERSAKTIRNSEAVSSSSCKIEFPSGK
jgi:hypothetical protein